MATSSERSPPPFPDSEEQDVLDTEEVANRATDDDDDDGEDLFLSPTNQSLAEMEPTLPPTSQNSDFLIQPPIDIMSDPLIDPIISPEENKPAAEVVSEPSDDFVDLTNNGTDSPDDTGTADSTKDTSEIPLDEPSDEFFDILGSESGAPQEEVVVADVTVEASKSEDTDPPLDDETGSKVEQAKETSTDPIINITGDLPASDTQQPPTTNKIADPLLDLFSDTPAVDAKKPIQPIPDLFEDEGSDLFTEPRQTKPAKQPQKSLFGEPDEDLFAEPLGATSKKTISQEPKTVTPKPSGDGGDKGANQREPADIFTEEAVITAPTVSKTPGATSKTNGVHSEEDTDIFAEATVELSLDSPHNERKKDMTAKPSASAPSLAAAAAAASLTKPQSAALEELEEEEEEEEEDDKFEINVSVTNPEKIGDGMNAYMAYKVSTETTLPMFRTKTFTVRRRFSDFLGLYEKLSEKHGPNGFIVPPPPEKSILGMTKVKVGKEDSSSTDFVERRRGALERYLQRVVNHPSLIQDPDVREFLEREELPRAVNTQALSGAGFLKMINKATDAVSKMTIKMNESDVWFEEKLQEVEAADQLFRKLHTLVESLVVHRKELSLNTASFAKSAAMLGSAEDNTALSRALSQLAEVEDKMEQLHQEQAANDTFSFAELIADFIRLLGAVRGSFDHRMKAWQRWQDAQSMLQKKRETEAKLLWANKPDKLQLAKEEIVEWEAKVTQYERDFERVSATVRKEVIRFEKERTKNFKRQIIKYMESLLQSQQQVMKYWEAFLPEAKAIA
ncbi:sorting nexin-1a [Sphaeramia orbicularis]|uniref:Sorting nexin-1 n=1 Tax=Sphaeramia orbicularis TaxID=375764 RepID=A0A673AI32_9TELE|nr:sorting nexin-1-like [Sphaeramia orbicularis]XP_029992291.1 sorting nexin-1-like [Sphaeramia orbicularis]XP_029992292.1 sorting nexin-1-like [Sphaeramia orbicularis]